MLIDPPTHDLAFRLHSAERQLAEHTRTVIALRHKVDRLESENAALITRLDLCVEQADLLSHERDRLLRLIHAGAPR